MKIVQINTFPYKATGNIMMNIHNMLQQQGHESYVVWARGRKSENDTEVTMEDNMGVKFHGIYTRVTDKTGFASWRATRKLIALLADLKPDVIHLHNIHGYYINIELLFTFLKDYGKPVVWTLHDCWSFTGHCAYFDYVKCNRWKTGCYDCPQKHTYPASKVLDNSKWNWSKKKELFTGLDMTIVTPSNWLADLVKQSFLKEHMVITIYNGIDTDVFKPTDSDFRMRNNLQDKFIILGVASEWSERKGLQDFVKLSEMLDDNKKIVLVGLNDKQLKEIPESIIGMKRTSSMKELAEIYSVADMFFNPTYEDNYPTVNLEALACGTQVVTYRTGGSPERLDAKSGSVVDCSDLSGVLEIIKKFAIVENEFSGLSQKLNKKVCFVKYIEVYRRYLVENDKKHLRNQSFKSV